MIELPSLIIEEALRIAVELHSGQVDKAGQPYILHCLRVMSMGKNDLERIVGLLHDILEDTEATEEFLASIGFYPKIIDTIKLLTKDGTKSNKEYLEDISKNKLARIVKMNDLKDNLNLLRLNSISEKDIKRINKYIESYNYLKSFDE